MTAFDRLLLAIIAALVVAFGIFVFVKEQQMSNLQTQLSTSMVAQTNLINNIQRSSAQFATTDQLNAFAQQQNVSLSAIQKDLDSLNATITGINAVVVNSQGQNQTNLPSTGTSPNPSPPPTTTTVSCPNGGTANCPLADTYKYTQNIQTLALNEDFSTVQVGIGVISFDASKATPWTENIYPRTYDITSTIGTNADTEQQFVYNQLSITSNGKSQTVPITSSKFVQQVPTATFSFWNPRLYLFTNGAVNISSSPVKGDATFGAALGIMSYGSSKTTPDVSVAQVGLGYSAGTKNATVVLNPVSYNVGKLIPGHLVNSTMVGPTLEVDIKGNVMAGAGISIGF
jgi:hypothetical protein